MQANKVGKPVVKSFTEGTLTHLLLKRIVDHPDIPLRELNEAHVADLSANIELVGLQAPLNVWNGGGEKGAQMKVGEGEDAEKLPASFLVAGNHRRAALKALLKRNPARFKELFPNGIPVMVLGGELKDAIIAMVRENVMREDMSSEQVFPALETLSKKESKGGMGMRQVEIAKAIGKSTAWVSQIMSIKEELGEEGVEALKKKDIGLAEGRKLASKIKKDKKSGKAVDPKAELKKATDAAKNRKAAGKVRVEKRLSATVIYKRYLALPRMKLGDQLAIAAAALAYLAKDENAELPDELKAEAEDTDDGDSSDE